MQEGHEEGVHAQGGHEQEEAFVFPPPEVFCGHLRQTISNPFGQILQRAFCRHMDFAADELAAN